MKKVCFIVLILCFFTVGIFAANGTVDLELKISKAVAITVDPAVGQWNWENPEGTTVESLGDITSILTTKFNCDIRMEGYFDDPYIVFNTTTGKGVKVKAFIQYIGIGDNASIQFPEDTAVGSISHTYENLIAFTQTGFMQHRLIFRLESDEGFQWYDVEADDEGNYTVTYNVIVEPDPGTP